MADDLEFDDKMIGAMVEDIFDYIHMAAPQEMPDDDVHQLGKIICLAVLMKLGGFLPASLN